ncbi:hypothetical protein BH09GEM1_BH09GEM1_31020 [soil metagenome]
MTILRPLVGSPITLPDDLLERYPELGRASWRRGGIFLRLGGWLLGRSTVSGITLWRTIWLAGEDTLHPELLLHELRHVHQFEEDPLFPLRYLCCSLRHGYTSNPYEADARNFAARRLAESHLPA